MEDIYVYCQGVGCGNAMRNSCRRYLEGQKIDPSAHGYSWMAGCDDEERPGYQPVSKQ